MRTHSLLRMVPIFVIILAAPVLAGRLRRPPADPIDARVDALLASMTLEEKVGQLSQYSDDKPEHLSLIHI